MAEPSPNPRSPKTWRDAPKATQAGSKKTSSRGRKIFNLLAVLGFLGGAVAVAVILMIRPAHPAFLVGIFITEYDNPHIPVNSQAMGDRQALNEANYFSAASKNLFTEQELDALVKQLKLLKDKKPDEPVVVYVSAHVICAAKGDLYLLPGRAKTDDRPDGWLLLRDLLDDVSACPSTNKLLILDTMHDLADPRLGVLANDSATRIRALLENEKYRDLQVLCACSAGQTSLASQDLHRSVFGYYVTEGLRGLADADGKGKVTVQGLYRFVRARVERWAKENRTSPQTPVLVHAAKDFELVRLEKGEVQPPPEANNAEKYPGWLFEEWQQRDDWWEAKRFRAAPLAFLQLEAALLRAEQQWRGGTSPDEIKESLKRRLTSLKEQMAREVPRPAAPRSLALEVGLGLREPDDAVGKAFEGLLTELKKVERAPKPDAATAAKANPNAPKEDLIGPFLEKLKNQHDLDFQLDWFVFEEAARDLNLSRERIQFFGDLLRKRDDLIGKRQGDSQYVETLFLHRLHQLALQVTNDGSAWPEVATKALRVVRAGEQAAACASERRPMCEPRVFPWIGELLEQAAQKRHDAEVFLFSPGFASSQEAGDRWREAGQDYITLASAIDYLQDAYAAYDEALARLPGYASYLMKRKENPRADLERWHTLIRTVEELHPLLAAPLEEGHPPVAASTLAAKMSQVRVLTDRLRKDLDELTRPFRGKDLTALLKQAKAVSAGPGKHEEIEAALAIPWLQAEDRHNLWTAGQALSRTLWEATRERDEQDGSNAPTNLPDFDSTEAKRQELERAALRAQLVLDLFKLGGWSGPEQLPEEVSRATQDPQNTSWPALADKLRKAWAELPKQLPKIPSPTARDRLSRVFYPLDAISADRLPSLQLREQQAVALWSWLSSRYQYEYRDFRGLNEEAVSQFYGRAANDYRKLLAKQTPDAYVEFTASTNNPTTPIEVGKRASYMLELTPQGAKKETPVAVSVAKNADFDVETKPGGGSGQVQVDLKLHREAMMAKGLLVEAQFGGRTFHHKLIPFLPPALKRQVELVLCSQKDSLGSALLDDVPLRPNQKQSFYAYVRNLSDKPQDKSKELKVKLEIEDAKGSKWSTYSEPIKIESKEPKLVEFKKLPPAAPAEKSPDLPRVENGTKVRALLVEAANPAEVWDRKEVRVSLMPPSEYVTVSPQFTPGEKNRLEVVVRWYLGTPIVGECPIVLVLDNKDIPGLGKIGNQALSGTLNATREEVRLYAENIEFAEDRANDDGVIHVTVDGYERAFNYRMAFPREGGISIASPALPTIRLPLSTAVQSGKPYILKLAPENTARDVKIEVGVDRHDGNNYVREKPLRGARDELIEFNPYGDGGSLVFVTTVKEWEIPLLGDKLFAGECKVQVRMLDGKGTLLEELFQTVTVDDTGPEIRFLKIDQTAVPKDQEEDNALKVEQQTLGILSVVAEGKDPESGIKGASFWVGEWAKDKPPLTPPVRGKPLKGNDAAYGAELAVAQPGQVKITVEFTNKANMPEHKTINVLVQAKAAAAKPTVGSIEGTTEVVGLQANVKVSLSDAKGTGETKETMSNNKGEYSFKDVTPGTYKLTATFGTRVAKKDVTVKAGEPTKVDLTLREP